MSKWQVAALCTSAAVVLGSLFFLGYSADQVMRSGDVAATISALDRIAQEQANHSLRNHGAFGTFPQLVRGDALDERFNSDKPTVYGYVFAMTVVPKTATQKDLFSINADPDESTPKGRHFYTDVSGSIHVNPSQPATAADPLYTGSTNH